MDGGTGLAVERWAVEQARSTLPRWRLVRTLAANAFAAVYSGGGFNWPPTDVVLVERTTGTVCRRWHEHGQGAEALADALRDDLGAMSPADFARKWDVTLA